MADIVFAIFRIGFFVIALIFVFSIILLMKKDVNKTQMPQKNKKADIKSYANLNIKTGPMAGAIFPIVNQEVTIGRSSTNALQLVDDYISSRHAKIYSDGKKWFIQDLKSTNGTWFKNHKIEGTEELKFGVPFYIGESKIVLAK